MASAVNGGRELSPSSALCGGLPERAKVAVKSDNWLTGVPRALQGGERWGHGLILIFHQVTGYSDKRLSHRWEFFVTIKCLISGLF
jgi:hypothetical protein